MTSVPIRRTEEALQHIVTLSFNENYTMADIKHMAGAIRQVAELLPRSQTGERPAPTTEKGDGG
jgi:hypothetical protein